jgi:hypothetical protein
MWHVEFPVESDLEPSTVWGSLIALDGQFALRGTLTSSSEGIPPLQSPIVELVDGEQLAVSTNFTGLILLLRHSVTPLDGGGTRLVRRLEITGSSADDQAAIAGPASARTTPRQSPRFSGWRDRACDG